MHPLIIITAAAVLLAIVLFFEVKEKSVVGLAAKAPLSMLFVATALLQSHPAGLYYTFLIVALVLCLAGDVLLALPQKKAFLIGLVSFLLGHVAYVAVFFLVAGPNYYAGIGAVVTVIVSALVFRWLRPHLGKMLGPVSAYIIIISLMVIAAVMVMGDHSLPLRFRAIILAGAVLFYLSDLTVARHRFVKKQAANRMIGLPLYYSAQYLLAFSPAFLAP